MNKINSSNPHLRSQKLVNGLHRTHCRPGVSKIHGVGLFAIKPIKKGTSIMKMCPVQGCWKPMDWIAENNVHPNNVRMMQDFFCSSKFSPLTHVFIPDETFDSFHAQTFLNHSLDPNVFINQNYCIEALRDIEESEEMTENYLDLCCNSHILFEQ